MLFWRKIFEVGKCPSPGLLQPRPGLREYPELSFISYVNPIEKYFAFEPSYVCSQGKLRCENLKI
jgi:hypothetical protein